MIIETNHSHYAQCFLSTRNKLQQKGTIKKTSLAAYSRPRQNGINAITVKEGDVLLEAKLTSGKDYVCYSTAL